MEERKNLPQWLIVLLFPAVLVYYEIVFHVSTVQSVSAAGAGYLVLFSLAYAGVGYLIATLPKNRKASFGLTLGWLILTVAPFLIEYFVYLQFKIFYDVRTCLNGAGGVFKDFLGDIFRLIFSWNGLSRIFLFLLPTVLFAVFGLRHATPRRPGWRFQVGGLCAVVLIFFLASFGVSKSPTLSLICGEEYTYQGVVSNLGLMTGLRMDVATLFSSDGEESFEQVSVIPQATTPRVTQPEKEDDQPSETVPGETEPVVYTPNVMDIDFDSVPNKGNLPKLNSYVLSQTPTMKNAYTGLFEGKNLILITAEAFTAEVIDPELTPTLYRLATKGIQFTDYYQPASCGTTGGEYQNIFGMLPGKGGGSFRASIGNLNYFTMGSQLDRLGYYGVAYHNHSSTYYTRHLTHNNLGYSEGFIAEGTGLEGHLSKCWPRSDVEMFTYTVPTFLDKQPFNIYYMTYSGHCGYTTDTNAFTKRNWDRVKDLDKSSLIKGYLAAQLELEDAMTYLVEQLEQAGIADDTVICLSTDHFPYGLDYGDWAGKKSNLAKLYGHPVNTFLERDHSRLILWCGCLEDEEPIVIDTPTSSLDILPTLSNLFGTEFDSRLMVGRDVFSEAAPLVFNTSYDWKTEYGTYNAADAKFTPADASVTLPDGYVDTMKAIVRNKVRYCKWALESDYYRYLFQE